MRDGIRHDLWNVMMKDEMDTNDEISRHLGLGRARSSFDGIMTTDETQYILGFYLDYSIERRGRELWTIIPIAVSSYFQWSMTRPQWLTIPPCAAPRSEGNIVSFLLVWIL